MKILRALTRPQFAEFCNRNDHLNCEPGEIVVPTCTMCRHMEEDPDCLCAKSFLGLESCEITTLGMVQEMNDEDAIFALAQSELAHRWWSQSNQTEFYARNHMLQISRALSKVEPGQLVRMRLIEGQRLEIYPIQFTYIEEMSWG